MLTIDDILFRVYKNPILQNVRKVDVVYYVQEVMRLLNIPATFEEKSIKLKVTDFRAPLPKELHMLRSVNMLTSDKLSGTRIPVSTDDRILQHRTNPGSSPSAVAYKQVPGWVYTDFEVGDIEVIYSAFALDSSGFPLIPNNASLLMAIENFIKVQYFTILVETGHMSGAILDRAAIQCDFYMGQASNFYDTPTEEDAESIFSALVRLVPDRDAFFTNFKYSSNTENLKNHD